MWICAVCGMKNIGNMVCPGCGFDEGKNYLQYLTLVKIPKDALVMFGLSFKGQKKETEIVVEKTDVSSFLSVDVLEGSFAFDSLRYLRESIETLYIEAMKNYTDGKCEDAFAMFMRAYENGNILAGLKLAQMYYWGEGCEKSYEQALPLFIVAKNYGYPLALSWLSECYRLGHGMPKDLQKSKKLHSQAESSLAEMCACGDRDAQYYYGYNLLYGVNCKEDNDKAFYWLNKAASDIHNRAGVELAKCYLNGWGCEKNSQKAINF